MLFLKMLKCIRRTKYFMKKILALTLMLMLLVSTVCFAAVSSSGSKSSSGSRSSSSSSSSVKSATPNTGGTYKPSAPANSIGDKAPAKQTTPSTPPPPPQSSTSSFWRNASMIGGGFLAGSLLGNMFGGYGNNMGGGLLSSIFGMLINIMLIGGVVMLGRYLWDKYKNKDKKSEQDRYR